MGQPSMPEIREWVQVLYRKSATLRSWSDVRQVVRWFDRSHAMGSSERQTSTSVLAVLPAAMAVVVPHAVVPVIVVTGLAGLLRMYLRFYAKNRRARSIAEIRRAAIKKDIPVSDAVKLIQADIPLEADPEQLEDDAPSSGDAESADGLSLRHESVSETSVGRRVLLMLRHLHLL